MPHMRRIECPDAKAEGKIEGFPYNTELASINGVAFHVWLGDMSPTDELVSRLNTRARNERDVVLFTYSDGQPSGFWAHSDF
jgi:hypothetical protein